MNFPKFADIRTEKNVTPKDPLRINARDLKKALDNPPFKPYYSNPYTISFQKMHIIWAGQFRPKNRFPVNCDSFFPKNN